MRHHVLPSIAIIAVVLGSALLLWPSGAQSLLPGHQCYYCHNMHGAPGFTLLANAQVEALCLTCHGPGGISTRKAEVHQNEARSSYPAFRITCRQCHDPHDNLPNWMNGINIELVGGVTSSLGKAQIVTVNSGTRFVTFESRGSDAGQPTLHSFADADEDGNGYYDGICETCHTLTKFHRNNSSGGHSHNTGRTCPDCHLHANYFIK